MQTHLRLQFILPSTDLDFTLAQQFSVPSHFVELVYEILGSSESVH